MTVRRVLAVGVFDLFHIGHLRYLHYASEQGEVLNVGVVRDRDVLASKHKLPVIPEAQRLAIVAALRCVDAAALAPCSTADCLGAASWIRDWGCELVVVGGNWQGSPRWQTLEPLLTQAGIAVSYAPHTPGISSSSIVQRCQDTL
ncbi:adenylyltransferase/cytidyltransferase family protein [Chitinilyticum litopenaei]|uniref:adenylyltransferase/cytidyltransferase family protein n=1 Tax=Chitinilyticum litopenaei TaxID=1121276 RepID=UPI00041ACB8D|nr:adenylyltransferase/cytidyltransferase family protein [Chitinilyticum litopenaei]